MSVHVCVCVCIYINLYIYIFAYVRVCVCVCVCMYIQVYTHLFDCLIYPCCQYVILFLICPLCITTNVTPKERRFVSPATYSQLCKVPHFLRKALKIDVIHTLQSNSRISNQCAVPVQ
jgi:hypothetical protein